MTSRGNAKKVPRSGRRSARGAYPKKLVCGIGNRLMGDDGFAQHVIELLEGQDIGADTADFGTAGLSVASDLCDYDFVIFVDTIRSGGAPGTVYEFEIKSEDIDDKAMPLEDAFSFHDSDLKSMLSFAKRIGCLPGSIRVIGCEPGKIAPSLELSPEVKRAVGKAANRVIAAIRQMQVKG